MCIWNNVLDIACTLNFDSLIEYLLIVTEVVYVTEVANG